MTAPLDYAPQPAVGDVTLDRGTDGATIVTVRASGRRFATAMAPGLAIAGTVLAVLGVTAAVYGFGRRSPLPADNAVLVAGLCVLIFVGAYLPAASRALYPIRWQVSRGGIDVAFRRPTHVATETYPAANVADVRVERIKLKNQLRKRPGLVVITPAGQRVVHRFGPRHELAFMATAFRDALGIGPDPLGEAALPPPLPWWRAVERQVGRTDLAVTLGAERWPADGLAIAVPAVVAGVGVYAGDRALHLVQFTALASAVGAMVVASLVAGGAVLLVQRLRRAVTVAVAQDHVTLVEQRLVRPGREQWPTAQVKGLRLDPRRHGRADLSLVLVDGTSISLLDRHPLDAARYAHDVLSAGLNRARPVPPPSLAGPLSPWV